MHRANRLSLSRALPAAVLVLSLAEPTAGDAATAAQPTAADEQPPVRVSPIINLRLDPELGDDRAALREFLLRYPYVRIAEPAEYELTTKFDFPLTLMLKDVRAREQYWDQDFELGNLELGDYAGPLDLALRKIERIRGLLALQTPDRAAIRTCISAPPIAAERCHSGAFREIAGRSDSPDEVEGAILETSVYNLASVPRHISTFLVDARLGVTRVVPGVAAAIPPGGKVQGQAAGADTIVGPTWLLTVASDRPVDPATFEQARFGEDQRACPTPDGQPCAVLPQLPADRPDWSVSAAEYRIYELPVGEMGGGDAVLTGMAAWMAEFYSTVPYTLKDRAEDALKPPAERAYPDQRTDKELELRCGGSLIAPDLVLTAAHCVAKDHFAGPNMVKVLKSRRVRIGTTELGVGGTTYKIVGVAAHSGYVPEKHNNDIALLLIAPDRNSSLATKYVPIRLGRQPILPGQALTIFGWGFMHPVAANEPTPIIDAQGELQHSPNELQYGRVVPLDGEACKKSIPGILSGMVCLVSPVNKRTGKPDRNVFSCRGDSGGPLVRTNGRTEELVGVTSWSMGCGQGYPSVYTDVTKYGAWIAAARRQLKPGVAIHVPDPAGGESASRR